MKNMKTDSRRAFLRNSGAALLAGYAFSNRTGLAQTVARPDAARYQSVTINTHEFSPTGAIQERLDLPKDWKIDTVHMVGAKNTPLTSAQILQKLRTPIGSKSLRDIAAGKKNACITFDDASRPTYFGLVAEQVINELNAAGIDDDHILFIGAVGSHTEMHSYCAMGKLGQVVYKRCPWETHNNLDNLVKVGKTGFNNMIELNGYFAKADVKILMGQIRNHAGYMFSGGPKGIIPGIVSVDTIFYNHCVVGGVNVRTSRGYEGDTREQLKEASVPLFDKLGYAQPYNRRLDALEAARLAGVDFSVSIIQNGTQDVIDLICGDVNESHLAACEVANNIQCYDHIVKAGEFDVVITNNYPTTQAGIRYGTPREGGISIAVVQTPLTNQIHKLSQRGSWNQTAWHDINYSPRKQANYRQIMVSQYAGKKEHYNSNSVEIYPTWDKVLPILEQNNKSGASVLLYPYNGNAWAKFQPRTAAAPAGGAAGTAAGAAR